MIISLINRIEAKKKKILYIYHILPNVIFQIMYKSKAMKTI